MNAVDSSTRLFDKVHLETIQKWYGNQVEVANSGKPRNTEKYKEAADELLQTADAIMKLEAAVKKGQKAELPQWYLDKFAPKPKKEAGRQTHNKIVAMPTPGQIQTIVARELDRKVEKLKGDLISVIRNELKVAK